LARCQTFAEERSPVVGVDLELAAFISEFALDHVFVEGAYPVVKV
jgi:hypothetical protein